MSLKNKTLSTELEYYQGIRNIEKKNSKGISKHCRYFQYFEMPLDFFNIPYFLIVFYFRW